MSKRLPRGVRLKRLQERRKKTLLRAIRKLLGVKRIRRKHFPAWGSETMGELTCEHF
jgi:hypothetical protein